MKLFKSTMRRKDIIDMAELYIGVAFVSGFLLGFSIMIFILK